MMNSMLVIVGVAALPFIKDKIGSKNRNILMKMPRGEWMFLWQVAAVCGTSEFLARKELMKMKKKGLVWEDNGMYKRV